MLLLQQHLPHSSQSACFFSKETLTPWKTYNSSLSEGSSLSLKFPVNVKGCLDMERGSQHCAISCPSLFEHLPISSRPYHVSSAHPLACWMITVSSSRWIANLDPVHSPSPAARVGAVVGIRMQHHLLRICFLKEAPWSPSHTRVQW